MINFVWLRGMKGWNRLMQRDGLGERKAVNRSRIIREIILSGVMLTAQDRKSDSKIMK